MVLTQNALTLFLRFFLTLSLFFPSVLFYEMLVALFYC